MKQLQILAKSVSDGFWMSCKMVMISLNPEILALKSLKLTESNYRSWNGIPEDAHEAYAEQIRLFLDDPLVDGWVPENVIYEVALKEGYRLDSPIEQVKGLQRNVIFRVVSTNQKQTFYICLDEELFQDDVDKLGLTNNDLFVCRDQAMDRHKSR